MTNRTLLAAAAVYAAVAVFWLSIADGDAWLVAAGWIEIAAALMMVTWFVRAVRAVRAVHV